MPFEAEDALLAARLAPVVRPYGLSLRDRVFLALAQRLGIPTVTADRSWKLFRFLLRCALSVEGIIISRVDTAHHQRISNHCRILM